MVRRWMLAAVLGTSACAGIPEVEFISEYEVSYCRGYVLCASEEMLRTVGERDCHEFFRKTDYPEGPECNYDREAAEVCLENLSTAGCADNDPVLPQSCVDVYSKCQFPLVPREDGNTVIE